MADQNNAPQLPYSVLLSMALMSRNSRLQEKVITSAFEEMTHRFTAVLNSFDQSDLPFAVATMLITANAVKNVLPDDGKKLIDLLTSRTHTMTINMEELRRQAREEGDGGVSER